MESEKKLLILVDDSLTNLKIGRNVLSERYDIATLPSAEKMFKFLEGRYLADRSPSMILLDIDMPEMSGFQAIKILKSKPKTRDIPVIFLTASTKSDDKNEGFSLGAIDYITKPFNPSSLLNRIEAVLNA
jgi:DNA-binding response OmpR family regulator